MFSFMTLTYLISLYLNLIIGYNAQVMYYYIYTYIVRRPETNDNPNFSYV